MRKVRPLAFAADEWRNPELRPGCLALKLVQNMPLLSTVVLWKMLTEQTEDAFYFQAQQCHCLNTANVIVDIHSGIPASLFN